MTEKEIVNIFVKKLQNSNVSNLEIHPGTSSKGMDISWVENSMTIGIEAKIFDKREKGDTRSQNILILIGNLLNGKKMVGKGIVETGFLFRASDKEYIITTFSKKFDVDELNSFAEIVSLKRIYFVDENRNDVELLTFEEFISQIKTAQKNER